MAADSWLRRRRWIVLGCAFGAAILWTAGVLLFYTPEEAPPARRADRTASSAPASAPPAAEQEPPEESPRPAAGPLPADDPAPADGAGSMDLVKRPVVPKLPEGPVTGDAAPVAERAKPRFVRARNLVRYDSRSDRLEVQRDAPQLDQGGIIRRFDPLPFGTRPAAPGPAGEPPASRPEPRLLADGDVDASAPSAPEWSRPIAPGRSAPDPAPETAPLVRRDAGPNGAERPRSLRREAEELVQKVRNGTLQLRLEIGAAAVALVMLVIVLFSGMIGAIRKLYGTNLHAGE